MKTSIATVCISGDFPEKLSAISAAGFDGIEIFESDFLVFDGGPRDAGRMVRDHGLEITLFQPFRDFEGMPEPQRVQAFDRAERKFDLMEEMGADLVLICSNVDRSSLGGVDRAAADLRELAERAARRGLRIGYEALAWGKHVNDHRDAWEIVRRADHPNLGLILDSFHTLARKIDPASIASIPGDRIFFVQLADAPQIDMDTLFWSRHFRNMPGQGDLDVDGFTRAVFEAGYGGPLSLEVFNDQFRGSSPRSVATDGYRSLVALTDRVLRNSAAKPIEIPELPPRIPVERIEFVEFAADDSEAESLGVTLSSMGFHLVGHHIRKRIDLWQQGDIRIVVNRDSEGFAHSAHAMHGMSVCDIGLRVEDANATVERAAKLRADTFEQPVGPGEMRIPAIRGVGGSILHFIDGRSELAGVWGEEFRSSENSISEHEGCGLTAIDHVAQTMNHDELLSWILFYTSIFDTKKAPMLDVVDPAGLVRSQAIENRDGTFRVTLNGAENRRTLAGRFISQSFGSGVQHIAFLSTDIFRTADLMRRRGFKALAISENYYRDLGARFGLAPDFVERLKACNVLYDRDDAGEYFQLYGPLNQEGLFFEIVQRRGAYAGYGAANAQFRIAAQTRQLETFPSIP